MYIIGDISIPCKHMLLMDSIIAQALPSRMSAIETDESVVTKLPVHEDDVSVSDAGTRSAELSERVDDGGIRLWASSSFGTLDK